MELESAPLFQDISKTIEKQQAIVSEIRVSITPKGEWHQPDGEKEKYWVKWMCWNLNNQHGKEITEPKLCVLYGDLDIEKFEKDLSQTFSNIKCIVDHDITME